jgi:hypothetical protein
MKRLKTVSLCLLITFSACIALAVFSQGGNIDSMKTSVVRVTAVSGDFKIIGSEISGDFNLGFSRNSGSGFAVGDGLFFVTNQHVVVERKDRTGESGGRANTTLMPEIFITGKDKRPVKASFVGFSPGGQDLALLRVGTDIQSVPAVFPTEGEMENLRVTQEIRVLGYPEAAYLFEKGTPAGYDAITVTTGKITRISNDSVVDGVPTRTILIDAVVENGNSGGPLFDEMGRVIGVNSRGTHQGFYWAFSALEVFPMLRAYGISPAFAPIGWVARLASNIWVQFAALAALTASLSAAILCFLISRKRVSGGPFWNSTKLTMPVPSARLVGLSGVHKGKQFPVHSFPFWLGRDGRCNVSFPSELDAISRRHCCIDKDHIGGFTICDSSTNGTVINGRFLTKGNPEKLYPGTTIKLRRSDESFSFEFTRERRT